MDVSRRWSRRFGCAVVRRALPELVSERREEGDAAVWRHLRACPACREEFAAHRRAAQALQSLAAGPGPDQTFFDALEARTLVAVAAEPVPVEGRRVGWVVLVAAACLLGAVVGQWLLGGGDGWSAPNHGPRGGKGVVAQGTAVPGAGLLDRPAVVPSPWRGTPPSGGRLVPVGYTPRQQGLRGQQQLCRDALRDLLPTAPSPR